MRRSSQRQRTAIDNLVRIEQATNPLPTAIIPPKQAPSSQPETPPKLPTETSGAPPPKSPEQPTITTPKEPPSSEPQAPPKSGHEPSTPPPLDSSGNPSANASPKQAFVIGVSGGTASGKTEVCEMIYDRLLNSQPRLYTNFRVVGISQDSFYHERSLTEEELEYAPEFNFDDPDAFDKEKLLECIKKLKSGQSVQVPQYNFKKQRSDSYLQVDPCDVLILKGILLLQSEHIRSLLDMKIFIDTDADVRLARRIERDTTELGRNVTSVLEQMLCLHTLIRDKQMAKHEFIFHADRLVRLVVERGLACFPSADFTEKQVTTPLGEPYKGLNFSKILCGVSINRSGEAMENALRACCAEIDIGKILFFRTEPAVVHDTLPKDISERHILLLHPVLASGDSATQAIELLEGKGVPESQIILLNIICAKEGIERVCKQYPDLKVVTSAIDVGVNEKGKVIPGIGDFGGRYYGTNDI